VTLDEARAAAVQAVRALEPWAHLTAFRPVLGDLYRELGELGDVYDLNFQPVHNEKRLPKSTHDREQLADHGWPIDDLDMDRARL